MANASGQPASEQAQPMPVTAMPAVPISQVPAENATALAEQEFRVRERKPAPAYLLCIFLGTLGLHRFYLRRNGSALAMLLITVLTGGIGALVTVVWAIVDLFLIGGIIREENQKTRTEAYGRFGLLPTR